MRDFISKVAPITYRFPNRKVLWGRKQPLPWMEKNLMNIMIGHPQSTQNPTTGIETWGLSSSPNSIADMSAHHIPILVELINCYHTYFRFKGPDYRDIEGAPIFGICFDFPPENSDICHPKTRERILKYLDDVRRIWYRKSSPDEEQEIIEDGDEDTLKLPTGDYPRDKRTTSVDLDFKRFGENLPISPTYQHATLPPLSPSECLQEARRLKSQGDEYGQANYKIAARTKYILASIMLGPGKAALHAWQKNVDQLTRPRLHH